MSGENFDFNGQGGGQQPADDFAHLLELASGGGQSQEPEFQMPEKIGGIPASDFEKLLVEATGGSVKGYKEFQETLAAREKYSELQTKFNELQEQMKAVSGGPKYSNELVQKIDELYRGGASEDQVQEFIKFQRMDVTKMDDAEVMKIKLKQDYPGFTDEEIDDLIEEDFGGKNSVKMKKAAIDARKELEQKKINISEPEHVRMQKIQFEEDKKRLENWQKVSNVAFGSKETHTFDITVGDQKTSVNFAIPEQTRKTLAFEIAKYATMNKIPATKEGFAHLQDMSERMLLYTHGKEIISTLFRDVSANTKLDVLQQVHNVTPINRGDGGAKDPVKKFASPLEEQRAKWNEEAMGGKWR